MKDQIILAGATGNLGGRIVDALLKRGGGVRALVRPGTSEEKTAKLREVGAEIVEVDMANPDALGRALEGAPCVVSALQGLRDVVVGAQSDLLDAALTSGVPRFFPSDYSSDFTKLPAGENRNFDLRREFHEILDRAAIAPTSILNGAFGEILTYGTPLLDFGKKTVGYWEDADWRIDFTTMDDTAAYTAAAALDSATPRIMRIAGIQISPRELAGVAESARGEKFELVRMGSLDDLGALARRMRAANPAGEHEIFPDWQQTQYMHSMFSVHFQSLDNDRYPGLTWTGAREVLAAGNR